MASFFLSPGSSLLSHPMVRLPEGVQAAFYARILAFRDLGAGGRRWRGVGVAQGAGGAARAPCAVPGLSEWPCWCCDLRLPTGLCVMQPWSNCLNRDACEQDVGLPGAQSALAEGQDCIKTPRAGLQGRDPGAAGPQLHKAAWHISSRRPARFTSSLHTAN